MDTHPLASPAPRDPLAELTAEHARAHADLDAIEAGLLWPKRVAGGGALLLERVARLEQRFGAHMTSEERVWFPRFVALSPQLGSILDGLRADHEELRSMLIALGVRLGRPEARERDEQHVVLARDLVDLLRLHMRKEEVLLFPLIPHALASAAPGRASPQSSPETEPNPPGVNERPAGDTP